MDNIQKFIEEANGLAQFAIPHAIKNVGDGVNLYFTPKDYEYYLQYLSKAVSALDMLEVMREALTNVITAEYAGDVAEAALQQCEKIAEAEV